MQSPSCASIGGLKLMPKSMKPGEVITVRYWHASKPAPEGWRDVMPMGGHHWRDVMPMGGHHWRGKIIQKIEEDKQ